MIPGICPTEGIKCDFYTEWCSNASKGISEIPVDDVVFRVTRLAERYACGEIGVDEDGPIEPFCAAIGAAALFSMEF